MVILESEPQAAPAHPVPVKVHATPLGSGTMFPFASWFVAAAVTLRLVPPLTVAALDAGDVIEIPTGRTVKSIVVKTVKLAVDVARISTTCALLPGFVGGAVY